MVLASQTFVIPVNSQQFSKLSMSLLTLIGAGAGFFTAVFALRNVLPNTPFLKRVMLNPPERNPVEFDQDNDPEATVHWNHLLDKSGEAITNLVPAGKAKISGQLFDVITDGRMIEKGEKIRVVEVTGNRVVVSNDKD